MILNVLNVSLVTWLVKVSHFLTLLQMGQRGLLYLELPIFRSWAYNLGLQQMTP